MKHRRNIQDVLDQADPVDKAAGLHAYQDYQDVLRRLAAHYGFGFVQTVAGFVALSPNSDYIGNLRSLVSVLQGINNNLPLAEIKVSTYNACRDRAYNYLKGEKCFVSSTKGPKTLNFYRNIIEPSRPGYITIDGHMYGIYVAERLTMLAVAKLGWTASYNKIAADFIKVARSNKLIPNQLQATLWFTWKRLHNVVYSAQLNLLNPDDPWMLHLEPGDIRPYG